MTTITDKTNCNPRPAIRTAADGILFGRRTSLREKMDRFVEALGEIKPRYYRDMYFTTVYRGAEVKISNPQLLTSDRKEAPVLAVTVDESRKVRVDLTWDLAGETIRNIMGAIETRMAREREQHEKIRRIEEIIRQFDR